MMRNKIIFVMLIALVGSIAVFGFAKWRSGKADKRQAASEESQIEYYTCGMHPSVRVSPEEYNKGKVNCPICNMKLTPVYKETRAVDTTKERKILFYRNPMNPSITSSAPAKDEMGMDYIPVYEEIEDGGDYYGCGMEGEEHVFLIKDVHGMKCPICGMPLKKLSKEEADGLRGVVSKVKIKGEQVRLAGVKAEPVKRHHLYKQIRTVGKVAYDTELAIAEEEFISSLKALDKIEKSRIPEITERTLNLVKSSKRKLRLLGLNEKQIKELEEKRQIHTNLILPEEKMWIYGDVYEYELAWVKEGVEIKVVTSSIPGEKFNGVISSINPVINPMTRSATFRAEVDNPDLKLQPEMYVDIVIMSMYMGPDGADEVLAIPRNALLDTGIRKIVWIEKGNGEYEGKVVEIGPEATSVINGKEERFYPVIRGLSEGEQVVTKANFLIDSQTQLTGAASAVYGGTLEEEGAAPTPPGHQH